MSSSKTLKAIIKVEGEENFSKIILSTHGTRHEALMHEVALHNKYGVDTNPKFYNLAKQTSTKFDASNLKSFLGRKHTEESKEKNRQAHLGIPSPNKGKPCPQYQKDAISKANKGHNRNKGRVPTDFNKRRSSEVNTGNTYCLGRKLSEDTKLKISAARLNTAYPTERMVELRSQGLSFAKIAEMLGTYPMTVYNRLRKNNGN